MENLIMARNNTTTQKEELATGMGEPEASGRLQDIGR
jgi:hypothetical protein